MGGEKRTEAKGDMMDLHKNTGTGSETPPPRQEGMTNITERDREEAARCWCAPSTAMIPMDVRLAEVFAAKLALQRETIARLQQELIGKERAGTILVGKIAELKARLTASEAKRKWTTEKPTVPGWYWWKRNPIATPELTRFELESDGVTLYSKGFRVWAKRWDGFFQGPLTPGEE